MKTEKKLCDSPGCNCGKPKTLSASKKRSDIMSSLKPVFEKISVEEIRALPAKITETEVVLKYLAAIGAGFNEFYHECDKDQVREKLDQALDGLRTVCCESAINYPVVLCILRAP